MRPVIQYNEPIRNCFVSPVKPTRWCGRSKILERRGRVILDASRVNRSINFGQGARGVCVSSGGVRQASRPQGMRWGLRVLRWEAAWVHVSGSSSHLPMVGPTAAEPIDVPSVLFQTHISTVHAAPQLKRETHSIRYCHTSTTGASHKLLVVHVRRDDHHPRCHDRLGMGKFSPRSSGNKVTESHNLHDYHRPCGLNYEYGNEFDRRTKHAYVRAFMFAFS